MGSFQYHWGDELFKIYFQGRNVHSFKFELNQRMKQVTLFKDCVVLSGGYHNPLDELVLPKGIEPSNEWWFIQWIVLFGELGPNISLVWWDSHVGVQNNGKRLLKFCNIIESNSPKTFFFVLYINMVAMRSCENWELDGAVYPLKSWDVSSAQFLKSCQRATVWLGC